LRRPATAQSCLAEVTSFAGSAVRKLTLQRRRNTRAKRQATRVWTENRRSIASKSAQPFPAFSLARASGGATRVTKTTTPDPMDDKQDVQRAGERNVVHHWFCSMASISSTERRARA
jgi:hypothetical protein